MDWALLFLILVALIFFVLGLVCVAIVILGLPGTWIMLALAVFIEICDGVYLNPDHQPTFPLWLLIGCAVLALIGEILEFNAGALGAKKAGSSNRGMIGALIGGFVGAIVGAPFGLIIGAFIGAVLGTFIGAILGELTAPLPPTTDVENHSTTNRVRESIKPATGAVIGRVLGTLSKLPIAIAVWLVLSLAAFWP